MLSEGQNLQDARNRRQFRSPLGRSSAHSASRPCRSHRPEGRHHHVFIRFLPQTCERIIRLRARVRQRLRENAEVVGADEAFFEDIATTTSYEIYLRRRPAYLTEMPIPRSISLLCLPDLKNAIDRDPNLQKTIPDLPNVIYSTKPHIPAPQAPEGVLVYVRTAEGQRRSRLGRSSGQRHQESQYAILKAASACPIRPLWHDSKTIMSW